MKATAILLTMMSTIQTAKTRKLSIYKDQSLEFVFIHFIKIMFAYFKKVEMFT